jgi:glycosyltransferase involved in cell wall biosynthesis
MLPALHSGGVERGTLELAAELVQRGHRSIVISAGGRLADRLLQQGSEHIAWDVGRKSLWTLRYVARLRRLLAEQQVDILHLRSRAPAWVGYLAWKGMPVGQRPRLVTTVHGPYSVNRYSAVMTRGERVIAVSEMIRDYITGNYPEVSPDIIRVIHRGVDPAEFPYGYRPSTHWLRDWYAEFPQTLDTPLVLLPARVTRWKGQEDFIELMDRLRAMGVEAHGLVVGGADPRRQSFVQELQAKIAEARLQDRITLVGHRSDLKEIMAVSDIVLSLSREPEAFGRTTLEALSLGRPVIGYDHGGVHEQLAAILPSGAVPVGDVAQVAERASSWLAAPPMVPRAQDFTLANMLEQTLQVYQELVAPLTTL